MKTAELTGAALDWAVAKIENPDWSDEDCVINVTTFDEYTGTICNYSTDWAQGGPIIECEVISLIFLGDHWVASTPNPEAKLGDGRDPLEAYGPTPLIAAMRCYVASKLGDEVEIPEELEVTA